MDDRQGAGQAGWWSRGGVVSDVRAWVERNLAVAVGGKGMTDGLRKGS